MLDTFRGLPTHALVVHAVVVLLPLAAVTAIAVALVPLLRRRFGEVVAALTILAAAAVPVATHSGEHLFLRKSAMFGPENAGEAALLERHLNLGHQLWPWSVTLLIGVLLVVGMPFVRARRGGTAAHRREAALARPGEGGRADLPDSSGAQTSGLRSSSRRSLNAGLLGTGEPWARGLALVGILAVLVGGVGSTIMVVRIGEAGSRAVWSSTTQR